MEDSPRPRKAAAKKASAAPKPAPPKPRAAAPKRTAAATATVPKPTTTGRTPAKAAPADLVPDPALLELAAGSVKAKPARAKPRRPRTLGSWRPELAVQLELDLGLNLPPAPSHPTPNHPAPQHTAPAPIAPPRTGDEPGPEPGQLRLHPAPWASGPTDAIAHAAAETVRRLGPAARDWVARTRHRYPQAGPAAIARLAADEAGRQARRGGAVLAPGRGASAVLGPLAGTGVVAAAQARLIVTIAAAYDAEPTPAELLSLLGVPETPGPLARRAGRLVAGLGLRWIAARAVPLGGRLASTIQSGLSTRAVADRTQRHYARGRS